MDSQEIVRFRERARSSLWLVPSAFVLLAVALAVALAELDRDIEDAAEIRFVFGGSPEAARSVLSVIAGSMVSLTALVFSILIVVFQLTSSQFSPRALRTFLQDRASKVALGAFLGTFAFSLTVLRAVRSEDGDIVEFVPRLSITVAFLASLASMGVFVYYIHHVSRSIRVSAILKRIHAEAKNVIDRLLPENDGETRPDMRRHWDPGPRVLPLSIRAKEAGYITSVSADQLVKEATAAGVTVRVLKEVGEFVSEGTPLLEIRPKPRELDESLYANAVHLHEERTMEQDLGYGFRQLADVAVRALSPGVNDPTTATMAVDRIEDLLLRVGRRGGVADDIRVDDEGRVRLFVPRQSWESLAHEALHEIAHYGRDSPQVVRRLDALVALVQQELPDELAKAVEDAGHVRQASPHP